MKKSLITLLSVILFLQAKNLQAKVSLQEEFTASVGVINILRPLFEGSHEYEVDTMPILDFTYGESFFLKYNLAPGLQGLGVHLGTYNRLKFSASLGYYQHRLENDSLQLEGLGDVEEGIDGRFFVALDLDKYLADIEYRVDFSGNHEGSLIILGFTGQIIDSRRTNWDLRASLHFADQNYMQAYFGICCDNESLLSGLTRYDAQGGLKNYSLNSIFSMDISRYWVFSSLAEYKVLGEAASDSPLIQFNGRENQFEFGIGISYKF